MSSPRRRDREPRRGGRPWLATCAANVALNVALDLAPDVALDVAPKVAGKHVWPLVLCLLGVASVMGNTTATAHAQSKAPDPRERLAELNRQALADYAANDFESARLGLREAIMLAGRAGLTSDPVMARLWADLGALYINGFHDNPKAQKAFSVAVNLLPAVLPSESMLTPEVRAALAAAGGTAVKTPPPNSGPPALASPGAVATPAMPGASAIAGAAAIPTTPGAPGASGATATTTAPPSKAPPPRRTTSTGTEPDLPAVIPQPLYCPSIDEAPPGSDVVIHCVLQPEIVSKNVTLFFRAPGEAAWTSAPTNISKLGWIKAVIPGRALGEGMTGKSLQYYLEARDAAGKQVARAGRDDSPNLLLVNDEATPLSGGVWAGMQPSRRRPRGAATGTGASDDDPLEELVREQERARAAAKVHRRPPGSLFVTLSAGTGYGWHPRELLEFYDDSEIASGWLPSGLFFFAPGVGYQLSDHWSVSAELRAQYIAQRGSGDAKPGSPVRGAFLVLGRLQYLIGQGNLQGTASLLAGGGDGFRLTIGPQSDVYRRNDSVRGGPLAAGAGLGATYHFSAHLALILDGRVLAGFAAANAVVFDLSGGLAVAF